MIAMDEIDKWLYMHHVLSSHIEITLFISKIPSVFCT